jgi:hypothetical protein
MRFQLALEDISVDVDNLIEMLIILKYATITQIGQEPHWPVIIRSDAHADLTCPYGLPRFHTDPFRVMILPTGGLSTLNVVQT